VQERQIVHALDHNWPRVEKIPQVGGDDDRVNLGRVIRED
jgi:hypothetical protein